MARKKRRIKYSRKGSLSLFLCIVLAGLILVLSGWLQAALMRRAEAELSQAMAAQLNVSLATYDRDLFSRFGLLAFTASDLDRHVLQNSLPVEMKRCPLVLTEEECLTDPIVLDQQMVRCMKASVPGIWLDSFKRCKVDSSFAFSNQTASAKSDFHSGAMTGFSDLFQSAFSGLTGSLINQTANHLFSQAIPELDHDFLEEMNQQYRQFAAQKAGVRSSSVISELLGGLPDFLNPVSLTRMAASLECLFDFSTPPLYEKLCVVEYLTTHLTRQATGRMIDGHWKPLKTPDGRSMTDLINARPHEIERIITGLEDADCAAKTVRFLLVSVRSLFNLAAILSNETQMAAIRATAVAIATAAAAASLGTILIEPEAVAYLIASSKALSAGISESERLIKGYGVRFWPGEKQIEWTLWYDDYLRLFLSGLPRSTLVLRFSQILIQLYPEPLYTKVRVQTRFAGRDYAAERGYNE